MQFYFENESDLEAENIWVDICWLCLCSDGEGSKGELNIYK